MNFAKQKKRLDSLLKDPQNHLCADCGSVSPTWASLDFGVFVCASCSGAHRGLGPTITRVKSANLDLWEEDWYKCMVIGNKKLNKYWQSNPIFALKKPKSGASNMEIGRYVYEKYIKRKYVTDVDRPDPLTLYKSNNYIFVEQTQSKQTQIPNQIKVEPQPNKETPKKKVQNLIDFDFDAETKPEPMPSKVETGHRQKVEVTEPPISPKNTGNNTSARYSEIGTSFTTQNSKQDFISFDQLLKTQKTQETPLHHSLSTQQVTKPSLSLTNNYHPYNVNLGHQNLVYNSYFHANSINQYQFNYLHSHSPQPPVHIPVRHHQYPLQSHLTPNVYVTAPQNSRGFNWS